MLVSCVRESGVLEWLVYRGPDVTLQRLESLADRVGVVSPRLVEARRLSRRSRSRAPVITAQFPGYVFLDPRLQQLAAGDRWRLRPLVLGGVSAVVPVEVVLQAAQMEDDSRERALPRGMVRQYAIGDRVRLVGGPLAEVQGAEREATVQEVRRSAMSVWVDDAVMPVWCSPHHVAPVLVATR